MKPIDEQAFKKMTKQEQDEHHRKVREELIKVGLVKPLVLPDQNASKSHQDRL